MKSRQLSCDLLGGSASNPYTKTGVTFERTKVWYGIVEFNVPLDTVDHFGDGDVRY